MKRKIIKQGNDTLTITLPRSWTKDYSVKAGDELNLELKGNTLILATERLFAYEKNTKDISKLTSVLPLVLLSLYRKGYDKIELKFENGQTLLAIQNILRGNALGYHIVDHGKSYCVLNTLADINEMDFNQVMRKLFLSVKLKLEKITEAITKKETTELHSVVAMNGLPARMTNFCYRLLSKRNLKELEKFHYYQVIITDLENLDNQINHIIHLLLNPSLNLDSDQLFNLIQDLNSLYCDLYTCYYEDKFDKFVSLINKRNITVEKLNNMLGELNQDENLVFLHLNNGFVYLSNIVDTAFLMNL